MTDDSFIQKLEEDVEYHGECHVIVSEPGAGEGYPAEEIEVRQGTATFNYEAGLLSIAGADTQHRIRMDEVIRYYLPREVTHG